EIEADVRRRSPQSKPQIVEGAVDRGARYGGRRKVKTGRGERQMEIEGDRQAGRDRKLAARAVPAGQDEEGVLPDGVRHLEAIPRRLLDPHGVPAGLGRPPLREEGLRQPSGLDIEACERES